MERVNQYFKDIIENFDITILVFKRSVRYLIYNWIQFFISMYNSVTLTASNDLYFEFNEYGVVKFALIYQNLVIIL
jgi:hypothetical protein